QLSVMSFLVNPRPTDSSQFLPYLDDAPVVDYLLSLDHRYVYWRWVPLYGVAMDGIPNLRYAVAGLLGRELEPRPLGRLVVDSGWDGTFEEFVRKAPGGTTYDVMPSSVAGTREALSLLRDQGVRVVLV